MNSFCGFNTLEYKCEIGDELVYCCNKCERMITINTMHFSKKQLDQFKLKYVVKEDQEYGK